MNKHAISSGVYQATIEKEFKGMYFISFSFHFMVLAARDTNE